MKNKIIFTVFALMCLICSMLVASAGKETQLTHGERLTYKTSIYGNLVTWTETAYNDLHIYNLSTGKKLDVELKNHTKGDINVYGTKVIWSDMADGISMYDISTGKETQIASGRNPEIYGNNTVYVSNQFDRVYLYNLNSHNETQIAQNAYGSPAIYGNNVVWAQKSDNDTYDIYSYDISTQQTSKITASGPLEDLGVYGNVVVWCESTYGKNGKRNVYMHDVATRKTTQVTTTGTASEPKIFGNRIVYTNSNSMQGSDIYMYNISTASTIRITTSTKAFGSSIYGDKIIYADSRNDLQYGGEVRDIYMYDLAA